jgi:hypothetical protein
VLTAGTSMSMRSRIKSMVPWFAILVGITPIPEREDEEY